MADNKYVFAIDFNVDSKDLNKANKEIKDTTENIEEQTNALTVLRKQYKQALGEAAAGSQVAAKRAAELKDEIEDLKDSVNSLNGSGIERINSSLGLLKDGLLNADPEKLKIGFDGLKAAMSAVPIFLLIEGLKYLYDNFDKVVEVLSDLIPGLKSAEKESVELERRSKELATAQQNLNTIIGSYISILEIQLQGAQSQNKSSVEQIALLKEIRINKLLEIDAERQALDAKLLLIKGKLAEKILDENLEIDRARRSGNIVKARLLEEKYAKDREKRYGDEITAITELTAQSIALKNKEVAVFQATENAIDNIRHQAATEAEKDLLDDINMRAKLEAGYRKQQLEADEEFRRNNAAIQARDEQEQSKRDKKVLDDDNALDNSILQNKEKSYSDRRQALKNLYDRQIILTKANNESSLKFELEYQQKLKELNDQEVKDEKDKQDKLTAEEVKAQTARIKRLQDFAKAVAQIAQNISAGLNSINDLQDQQAENAIYKIQSTTNARQEQYDQDTQNQLSAIDDQLSNQKLDNKQRLALEESRINVQNAAAEATYQLQLDNFTQTEKIKKKQFENDKKYQIAQAIITTAVGALAAYTNAVATIKEPVTASIVGGIAAAAVVALGAIQIATIRAQQYQGGAPPAKPQIQRVDLSAAAGGDNKNNNEAPPIFGLNAGGAAVVDGERRASTNNQQPIRVYVTETDITKTQTKVNVLQVGSTYP